MIAGQFIFFDNNEDAHNTQLKFDAYQFETQLLTKLKLGDNLSITVAPAIFATNDESVGSAGVLSNGNLDPGTCLGSADRLLRIPPSHSQFLKGMS